jgi:dolichol-phosphate mannosyltransferase
MGLSIYRSYAIIRNFFTNEIKIIVQEHKPSTVFLSVVVPVHNEAENIAPLITEIQTALKDKDYEIIYVNDGSTDDTQLRLDELRQTVAQLTVIQHQCSFGQSVAVITGVKSARGQWIATLDGDGQNDPADIPGLLKVVENPHCSPKLLLIAGYRSKRQDTRIKKLSSKIANGVRASLLHDNTPDTGCGLKLFSRTAFLELPHFRNMHRFLPALFLRDGYEVVSVEVNHRPRLQGYSKYGVGNRLWVGIVDMFGVMWLQHRKCKPELIDSGKNQT